MPSSDPVLPAAAAPVDARPRWSSATIALTGLAGTTAAALAAVKAGALPWDGRWPLLPSVVPSLPGTGPLLPLAVFYGGLVVLARAWLALVARARAGELDGSTVVAIALLWCAPLFLAPPVASRDAYAYLAQGTIAAEGHDPAVVPPSSLPSGPVRWSVDLLWIDSPSPYGPVASATSEVAARAPGVVAGILVLRMASILGLVGMAVGLSSFARRLGRDVPLVLALVVANPLVIVHLVGGAHNEAWALGLGALGLAAHVAGKRGWGVVLLTLAALVKLPFALVLGWVLLPRSWRREHLGASVGLGALAIATAFATHAVTGFGWAWLGNVTGNSGAVSWLSITTLFGLALGSMLASAGLAHAEVALAATRFAGAFASASAGLRLLTRPGTLGPLAPGLALLAMALLGPAVHPWYLTWSLPLIAVGLLPAVGPARTKAMRWLLGVSIVATFAAHPGGAGFFLAIRQVDPGLVAGVLSVLALVAIVRVPNREQRSNAAA